MQINGIEYEINTNIKLGVQRRLKEDPTNFDNLSDFLKNVLMPPPSLEEIDEMGNDDVQAVTAELEKVQKQKNIEFKKKLSR